MRKALKHLSRDPVLATIIKRVGPYAMQFAPPTFENLVRSIVSQQLSGRVAAVIFKRLIDAMPDGNITPEGILKLRTERMRKLGLSGQKTIYIRELAKHVRKRKIVFEDLPDLSDEDVIAHLTQVKGIGVWTAHMFLMFALRRDNVLPVGDLGVRSAIQKAYGLSELPKPAEIEALSKHWHPYCSVASWYLWRSLDFAKADLLEAKKRPVLS